jgi:putative OPT family oligopeptide transporter
MGILRFFKNATILENNAVQTAASAGEAVAGGIVYTIPALIVIQYWHHFDYVTNFLIAFTGGTLGVLFSIPLRRLLVHDKALKFPEGQAIAEVLKSSSAHIGVQDIVYGSILGAILELLQVGLKVIANSWTYWVQAKRTVFGVGAGFSATLIGAGYLIGFDMACSIFIGAVLSWLLVLPVLSHVFSDVLVLNSTEHAALCLWNGQLRFFGIGAMLFAGVWTFLKLIKPLANNIYLSLRALTARGADLLPRIEQDIPMAYILLGIVLFATGLFVFFQQIFPAVQLGVTHHDAVSIAIGADCYVLMIGFLFVIITSYFSGMVGVTASPGSSVVIAGILFASYLLLKWLHAVLPWPLTHEQTIAAEAIVIIVGSVVTGIAAIANDNTQDLKVGQLVGATPWKQQLMLLLGVLVSSLVIPPVMQVLFEVYGIAGIMPHAGMDSTQSLPAPTAALLAAITEAMFSNRVPWMIMGMGAASILALIIMNRLFRWQRFLQLSMLGVAIGMYLPIASSVPLFIGGVLALVVKRSLAKKALSKKTQCNRHEQTGTRIACGLVAGSALMDVLLAIVFSSMHSPDALSVVGDRWGMYGVLLAIGSTGLLVVWMKRRICR